MKCPYCGESESKVVDSREIEDAIRRRRECSRCAQRFTTYERTEGVSLAVVKKDGRREPYDQAKLARGIRTACFKRPIPAQRIDDLVREIEGQLYALGKAEVSSQFIGEQVMARLRDLDDVAFVRFASVYRQFRDVDGLVEHIEALKEWKRRALESKMQLQFNFDEDQPHWN
ncbi:MAG: transcriptional repressor NrdR [Chloroflexi bacterium]|nr:transcriptional repressor NrdR [Chloroflexota bacterium]